MELVTLRPNVMKRVIESIKEVVCDVSLICEPDGIKIHEMDADHANFAQLCMKAELFETYKCNSPQLLLPVTLADVHRVLKTCGNSDCVMTMQYREEAPEYISVEFSYEEGIRKKKYQILLRDLDYDGVPLPDTHYSNVIKIASLELQQICRDIGPVSKFLRIHTTKTSVVFSSGDSEQAGVELQMLAKQPPVTGTTPTAPEKPRTMDCNTDGWASGINLVFPMKPVLAFTKGAVPDQRIRIYLNDDGPNPEMPTPMLMEYELAKEVSVKALIYPVDPRQKKKAASVSKKRKRCEKLVKPS